MRQHASQGAQLTAIKQGGTSADNCMEMKSANHPHELFRSSHTSLVVFLINLGLIIRIHLGLTTNGERLPKLRPEVTGRQWEDSYLKIGYWWNISGNSVTLIYCNPSIHPLSFPAPSLLAPLGISYTNLKTQVKCS